MQKSFRIVLLAALIGLGIWGWRVLFPNPEKVIRSRLVALADTASFQRGEGNVRKIYALQKLPDFFTTNVTITAGVPGRGTHTLEGRDELMQAATAVRQRRDGLKVEFVDIVVTLAPDKQTATVDLTAKISSPGQSDFTPQEFNFGLKKVDGKWLVYKIETVKTLSLMREAARGV